MEPRQDVTVQFRAGEDLCRPLGSGSRYLAGCLHLKIGKKRKRGQVKKTFVRKVSFQ